MGTREAMIREAEKALGVVGRPNYMTREYAARNGNYFAGAAWCNMAITYWARHSGNFQEVNFGTDYAYTVYHAQRFQRAGRWYYDTAGIRRGDIVFFDWAGTNSVGAIDHIGIVTDVQGAAVYTIEGNTGDRCARRVRYARDIVGYGRPDYDSEPATPPSPGERVVHTVVSGDTLWALARRYNVPVADIRLWNGLSSDIIDIGQRLYVSKPSNVPTPPPPPTPPAPEPVGYVPPPFPVGIGPGKSSPSAKPLQRALKAAGYLPWWVAFTNNYGSQTETAVVKFHQANPQFSSSAQDPAIGPRGWDALHREAYDK